VDGALHADDAEGTLSRHDRHAEIRLGGDAHPARPDLVEVLCPVEQQGRAGLEDARGQPLAEGDRRRSDPPAELAVEGKLDRVRRRVVQGDVHDVGVERLEHLLAHELDQRREIELPRQRVTNAVDDRQLGGALPRFVQQPGPPQGRGDVLADERQQLLVLLRVADILGVALHDEDAERPPLGVERYAEPVDSVLPDDLDLASLQEVLVGRWGSKQRLAGAKHVGGQTPRFTGADRIPFVGVGHVGLDLVDVVRPVDRLPLFVVERDEEVARP
jgi:hypothetical protein